MKAVCAAVIVLACSSLLEVRPSYAEIYRPWCAVYQVNRDGGTNCGFVSYQQCMMTAGPGTGASCVRAVSPHAGPAVPISADLTFHADQPGCSCSSSAAAPATCGVAIDVPLSHW